MIELDGSVGIGGGQVLRTGLAYSAIHKIPICIKNIRVDRDPPGLAAQHLAAVRSVSEICNATVDGASLRSSDVVFQPETAPQPGDYSVNVSEYVDGGSAGSVTLLFQVLLWPLSFAEGTSTLTLEGGTHVAWSPPVEYLSDVYLPAARELGVDASVQLERHGFFPAGGGKMSAEIHGRGVNWTPASWQREERGDLYTVDACSMVSNLPEHILDRQADQLKAIVENNGIPVRMETRTPSSDGPGTAVYLHASYEHVSAGFSSYGRRGKPAEEVAREAADAYLDFHATGKPVQAFLADQLLLPLCLAEGASRVQVDRVSGHLLTLKQVLDILTERRIEIDGTEGEPGVVTVR